MTLDQLSIWALLAALLAVFALDRFRVELVALAGLAAGIVLGLVPSDRVFSGLSSPAVITVAEILLIIHALQRSRFLDRLAGWLCTRLRSNRQIVVALCLVGGGLSMVMNNIGAFALMLPVANSVVRQMALRPRAIFMPLSFATLLGGLCTTVGTPANLVVSDMLMRETGSGFAFLSFVPTGVPVAAGGLLLIALWTIGRLEAVPQEETGEDLRERRFVCELELTDGAPQGYLSGDAAGALAGRVHNVVRNGRNLFPLDPGTKLQTGDILLVDADRKALQLALASGIFAASGHGERGRARIEAAVMPRSTLVGSKVAAIEIFAERDIGLIAVATQNPRIEGRLSELQLGIGDVLHLEGEEEMLRSALADTGLIEMAPLAPLEKTEASLFPVIAFAVGIAAAASDMVSPALAFGAVVAGLAFAGAIDLRSGLAALNWPILILLAAMLPLGEAVATTGAAASMASGLAQLLPAAQPLGLAALMLGMAIIVTPFVNNATTAIILGPIAIELSHSAGVSPALLLMAVAIGASSDFLTPFGHHNNTIAYGLGNYRFRDFFLAGWPLILSALAIGSIACVLVWG